MAQYEVRQGKAVLSNNHRWYVFKRKKFLGLIPYWVSVKTFGFPTPEAAHQWIAYAK